MKVVMRMCWQVLNISGNEDITELPPEMGLLSRLWNLNTRGCSLQEPLKSMIESKKYKTMDVIGYLKVSFNTHTNKEKSTCILFL